MDRLSGMVVFTKVVDNGSFSAAAETLGVSKSAVSKKVAELEDRLGVRLLHRTTRRLNLTAEGAIYYKHSSRIVADIEAAEWSVTRHHAEPSGRVRVTASTSFGNAHLMPALTAFMKLYPKVTVEALFEDRIIDIIGEGIDIAIRLAVMRDSSLVARKLAPYRQVVCATPEYWAEHGQPRTPEDLRHHDCLIYTHLMTSNTWRFQVGNRIVPVRVEGRLAVNNGDALRAAALTGAGVYMGPNFIVGDDIFVGRLIPVLGRYMARDRAVYAVYPHRRHLPLKVRALVDFLSERFRSNPKWHIASDDALTL